MYTILLVDDYGPGLDILKWVLLSKGYNVFATTSAKNGLLVASTGSDIDLVITDYTMPQMSGAELIGELRRFKKGLPVILYSGGALPACGADAYVAKGGGSTHQLLEQIAALLRGRSSWKTQRKPVLASSRSLPRRTQSTA